MAERQPTCKSLSLSLSLGADQTQEQQNSSLINNPVRYILVGCDNTFTCPGCNWNWRVLINFHHFHDLTCYVERRRRCLVCACFKEKQQELTFATLNFLSGYICLFFHPRSSWPGGKCLFPTLTFPKRPDTRQLHQTFHVSSKIREFRPPEKKMIHRREDL